VTLPVPVQGFSFTTFMVLFKTCALIVFGSAKVGATTHQHGLRVFARHAEASTALP